MSVDSECHVKSERGDTVDWVYGGYSWRNGAQVKPEEQRMSVGPEE